MTEFLAIYAIFVLGLISPGPDFAYIAKLGLTGSRGRALRGALGIALSNLVHIGYCMLGIGVLIARSILLFNAIKLIGAGYLLYIGTRALLHRTSTAEDRNGSYDARASSSLQDIAGGFLCNLLNPKCTLFFLALFTQVIDPHTPMLTQIMMGLGMATTALLWFSSLGCILQLPVIRAPFKRAQSGVERVMGALLMALGLRLAFVRQE